MEIDLSAKKLADNYIKNNLPGSKVDKIRNVLGNAYWPIVSKGIKGMLILGIGLTIAKAILLFSTGLAFTGSLPILSTMICAAVAARYTDGHIKFLQNTAL